MHDSVPSLNLLLYRNERGNVCSCRSLENACVRAAGATCMHGRRQTLPLQVDTGATGLDSRGPRLSEATVLVPSFITLSAAVSEATPALHLLLFRRSCGHVGG
jgi:hypothetical protein